MTRYVMKLPRTSNTIAKSDPSGQARGNCECDKKDSVHRMTFPRICTKMEGLFILRVVCTFMYCDIISLKNGQIIG